MANKNKKIRKLVKATAQETPAGLELIPTLTQAVSGPCSLAESNDNTIDFDESPVDLNNKSDSELKEMISRQGSRISDLEYKLEDSRMRLRGLQEEIKVREEITVAVNRDVRDARKQLIDAADELETLNQKYLQMRARYDKTSATTEQLRSTLESQKDGAAKKDARIAELEDSVSRASSELADLRNYVAGRKENWSQRDAENAILQAETEQLRQVIRKLEAAAADPRSASGAGDAGKLSQTHAAELERLQQDNERFEAYGNDLRIKLQDQIAATQESNAMRQKLEANLEIASRMINDLTADLEREQEKSRDLTESSESLRADFERETRQIRLELGVAQNTISEQDTINQQLASDLIDNQGFRQALESHLSELEKENTRAIQRLEKELEKSNGRIGQYEHKIRVKDGAIADLMQELADQSSKLKLTGELESALQKIDGHRPDRAATAPKGERVTRQLIGSADGKELRFPLFRKRLSIGRTRHNDIQLDLRFVSRRHAVIATDNNATRIIDWGSRNGVYVNKKRITEKVLKSGDVITIGLTNLRYEERSKR